MALDEGWPAPPAAAPDPELRTIPGDGVLAATAAVPGAGAPFFAVLGLVPGRLASKMGLRTVRGPSLYQLIESPILVFKVLLQQSLQRL